MLMMKPEERLDRLERIARLLVSAGFRSRSERRQQDEKITIMIKAQIKNEERFAKLAQARAQLASSQEQPGRLDALRDTDKDVGNGRSDSAT